MNKNKNGYYLELLGKPDDNFQSIIYIKQSGFKTYINKNICVCSIICIFTLCRKVGPL
jgi:hypothetical protein